MTTISESRQQQLSPGLAIKTPCRVATTAAIVLSGEQTIDGIACVDGDRVLVKDQASSVDNGVYTVSTGSWSRAPDFDGTRDTTYGTLVIVNFGSSLGRFYRLTATADPIVFGTSAITFALSTEVPVALTSFPQIVDTIAALQALPNPGAEAVTYLVRGKLAIGDGQVRIYRWNQADATADDGVTILAPTAGTGRWNLLAYLVTPGKSPLAPTNVAAGPGALESVAYGGVGVGDQNTANGKDTLKNTTVGRANTANGHEALKANITGTQNAALTGNVLVSHPDGDNNVAGGNGALYDLTSGDSNVVLGVDAMRLTTQSSASLALGTSALQNHLTGGQMVAVGSGALANNLTGTDCVALGTNAGKYETGSNAFYIDNADRTNTAGDKAKALMYGQFHADPGSQRLVQNAVVTKPYQSAFLARATTTANATGDATVATVIWGTEVYDQDGDFAANAFTARVAGRHHFDVSLRADGLAAGSTVFLVTLVTSNRSIVLALCNPGGIIVGGGLHFTGGIDVDMDAGDTATVTFRADGTAKVVGYDASSSFSGHLAC